MWLLAVVAVLIVWAVRVRRLTANGDEKAGFALTGIVTCLVSPITWVHHLVWVMPALLVLLDRALDRSEAAASRRRRGWLWTLLIVSYVVLGSRVVWAFDGQGWEGLTSWFASNAYVWVSIALLIGLPAASTPVPAGTTPATAPPGAPSISAPVSVGSPSSLDHAMASLLHEERVGAGEGVRPPG